MFVWNVHTLSSKTKKYKQNILNSVFTKENNIKCSVAHTENRNLSIFNKFGSYLIEECYLIFWKESIYQMQKGNIYDEIQS